MLLGKKFRDLVRAEAAVFFWKHSLIFRLHRQSPSSGNSSSIHNPSATLGGHALEEAVFLSSLSFLEFTLSVHGGRV